MRGIFGKEGFTLIELLITIAIVAILTGLALPSFQNFIRRNAVASEVNQLVGSLQTARTLALSGNFESGVCRATLSGSVPSCVTVAGRYDGGHAIYTLNPPPRGLQFKSYVAPTVDSPVWLQAITAANQRVRFDTLGRLIGDATLTGVEFTACYKGASASPTSTAQVPGVGIFVARSGRISTVPIAAAATCVPNDARTSF